MTSRQGRFRGALQVLAGLLLLGTLIYLTVLAFIGDKLSKAGSASTSAHDARPWLVLALVGALAALAIWVWTELERSRLERSERELETTAREAEDAKREAEDARSQAEQRLQESERERRSEREQQQRFARAWKAQRDWNRELREQVAKLQHQRGLLGHFDVRDMVLRLTMELVEAEKGMLLSRQEDGEGKMEVVCAMGFRHDPADSGLAQRFAHEVIERDTTLRIDQPGTDGEGCTEADKEVENLVAIPMYLRDEFSGVILCANRTGGFEDFGDDVLIAVGDHAGAVLQNTHLHAELRNAYLQTVRTLSSVIEVKDPDLRGHSDAVAEYVMSVADELSLEPRRREALLFGALLHDVGKIGISERILLKPGPLTEEEFAVMQLHPRIGYHLIRQIPALEPIAPAVLHHHERFDGTGYPGRLRGEMIPLEARVIAVADAFSAMIAERPYREPVSVEEACRELERCAGSQFDPRVVELFVGEVRRRPPAQLVADPLPPDPELEIHRQPGSFVLGGTSFGIVDSLTMLYSHRHFHETTNAEARQAAIQERPFALIVARLGRLEHVNREHGFATGDAAIQEVAEAFRRAAGQVGGTAFRVSGSRIGLIVPGLDRDAGEHLAYRIRDELRTDVVSAIGVSAWQPGESAEQIIERAMRAASRPEDPLTSSAQPEAT